MQRQIFGRRATRSTFLGFLTTLATAAVLVAVPQSAQAASTWTKCLPKADVPGFTPVFTDDSQVYTGPAPAPTGKVVYAGLWDAVTDAYDGAQLNTLHFTKGGEDDEPSDNWAWLNFDGNAITFYYRTEPGAGAFNVYMDGQWFFDLGQSSYDGGRYYKSITFCENANGSRRHKIGLHSRNQFEYAYNTNVDAFLTHQFTY
ncbi:MAG TPA: hypothetical protein VGX25_10535 [Actinophytocola sp.]|uniref:hypothetical protein n=1 Tax=Actinophytocola sp. TaxID=1872138 RepID=UPI002DDCCDBD|nr:hypothetical protein [Actinophytocola sp.]HEV2779822.1 hypothetical protein [Actinophytocola sp.]